MCLRHDERINCPFWLVLFAPCCVAHHSGSFGYPHSSRLAWHKNYCAIIEHFILSSCLTLQEANITVRCTFPAVGLDTIATNIIAVLPLSSQRPGKQRLWENAGQFFLKKLCILNSLPGNFAEDSKPAILLRLDSPDKGGSRFYPTLNEEAVGAQQSAKIRRTRVIRVPLFLSNVRR